MISKGVKYIKINRKDIDGDNHSIALEELNTLKIKYRDIGILSYEILQRAEYADYYLYQVTPLNVTSSTDDYILDYYCFVRSSSLYSLSNILSVGEEYKVLFPVIQQDIQNNFNNSTSLTNNLASKYIFHNTPNIPLEVRFRATASSYTNPPTFSLVKTLGGGGTEPGPSYPDYYNLVVLDSGSPDINGHISLNYTGNFLTNNQIFVLYDIPGIGNFDVINTTLEITQSIPSNTGSNLVILEPYIEQQFQNSDFDVLINNVYESQPNEFYLKVDYLTNQYNPNNYQLIISNSGYTLSNVKQYYYNLRRHIYPRYQGTKLYSAYINQYTNPTKNQEFEFINGDTGSYLGDKAYGKTPNIYLKNSHIYEIKWGGSTYPEILNCGGIELGNILEVDDINDVNKLTYTNNDIAYNYIINDVFRTGSYLPKIVQYTTNINITNNLKIISNTLGVPPISNYWIPSNLITNDYSRWNVTYSAFEFRRLRHVIKNEKQQYDDGGLIGSIEYAQIFDQITSSINNGDKWFMTIAPSYDDVGSIKSPLSQSYYPWNYGYTSSEFYFESKGVYPIISASGPSPRLLFFQNPLLSSASTPFSEDQFFGYGGPMSMLLWKAIIPNETRYIIVEGSELSGLGKGAMILSQSNDSIINGFNQITYEFGTNPTVNKGKQS